MAMRNITIMASLLGKMTMTNNRIDGAYVASVLDILSDDPSNAEMSMLLEAHVRISYYAAIAQGIYEEAKAVREYNEATCKRDRKLQGDKITGLELDAYATIETWPLKKTEISAQSTAKKLSNLLGSITETVNGIKFLHRAEGTFRVGP